MSSTSTPTRVREGCSRRHPPRPPATRRANAPFRPSAPPSCLPRAPLRVPRQSCSLPFCHPPSGSWVLFSFLAKALTGRTESGPGGGDRSPGLRALRAHPCARRAPSAPVPAAAAPGAPPPPNLPAYPLRLRRSGEAEGRRCDSPPWLLLASVSPRARQRQRRRQRQRLPSARPLDSTDACRAPSSPLCPQVASPKVLGRQAELWGLQVQSVPPPCPGAASGLYPLS